MQRGFGVISVKTKKEIHLINLKHVSEVVFGRSVSQHVFDDPLLLWCLVQLHM
jgi:hypothetical protein